MIELALGCARVWCTDRHGGSSAAPYDSLNLAPHVEDDPAAVRRNKELLAAACAGTPADPDDWAYVHHVHGIEVLRLTAAPGGLPSADGGATATVGLPLVAIGADCAPIALVNDTAVAAVHAGWRGLEAGVVAEGVEAVRALGTGEVRAVIGPCIHAECYEFGAAELERLATTVGPAIVGTTAAGTPALDMVGGIRTALAAAGVTDITDVDVCTACSADHFSFRRDGRTGRQGMVVVKVA